MNRSIIICNEDAELYNSVFAFLKDTINNISGREVNIALSGGETPIEFFSYLSNNKAGVIDWSRINFFWADERCVSPDNNESNFKNAFINLFSPLSINMDHVFRIKGEVEPKAEAIYYSDLVSQLLIHKNGLPTFDIIFLGIGKDGHIASIFPGNDFEEDKLYFTTKRPSDNQDRISISMKCINNASNIVFLVKGEAKRDIVSDVINKNKTELNMPAMRVNPTEGNLIFFMNKEASLYNV